MTSYRSRYLLDIRPNFQDVRGGVVDDLSVESIEACAPVLWKTTAGTRRKVTLPFILSTKAEIRAMRSFIASHAGRRRGFWLPVWTDEYRLAADATAGTSSLDVEPSRLSEARTTLGDQFDHLFLASRTAFEAVPVSASMDNGTGEALTLGTALANDWTANKTACGGLLFVRLAEDEIEFNHLTDSVAEVRLTVVELPQEYTTAHAGEFYCYLYAIERFTDAWRYCNAPFTIFDQTLDWHEWAAASIAHGDLVLNSELLPEEIELRCVTDDPNHPLRWHLHRHNVEKTVVRIWELDLETGLYEANAPVFVGEVASVDFSQKGVIKARVSSAFNFSKIPVPRVLAQRTCNHSLYGVGCGVSRLANTVTGTVDAITDTYVEAAEFATKADDWFSLGRIRIGDERRLITKHTGARVYINAPFMTAAAGDAVSATAGCNKRIRTCHEKFDNLANILAFPYVPRTNPQFQALCVPQPDGSSGKK